MGAFRGVMVGGLILGLLCSAQSNGVFLGPLGTANEISDSERLKRFHAIFEPIPAGTRDRARVLRERLKIWLRSPYGFHGTLERELGTWIVHELLEEREQRAREQLSELGGGVYRQSSLVARGEDSSRVTPSEVFEVLTTYDFSSMMFPNALGRLRRRAFAKAGRWISGSDRLEPRFLEGVAQGVRAELIRLGEWDPTMATALLPKHFESTLKAGFCALAFHSEHESRVEQRSGKPSKAREVDQAMGQSERDGSGRPYHRMFKGPPPSSDG